MQLAGCILKDKDNKVLLIHRNTGRRTQWEIPGGKVKTGESPEQTAVRELKEELDVVVEIVKHLGMRLFEQDNQQHEYHWFEAKIIKGKPRLAEAHIYDDLKHFAIDEMRHIQESLSANTKNFILAAERQEITI